MAEFTVLIPARYASTRFPGKVLVPLAGRPMLAHVHDVALAAGARAVVVATDDERVARAVAAFGGHAVLTGAHASGSDRIAAAAAELGLPDDALLVNLQGDEPLMPAAAVRQVAEGLAAADGAELATLSVPLRDADDFHDPNVVKVVTDARGRALYFSRAPIPWPRDGTGALPEVARRHVGIYAYRHRFLRAFTSADPPAIEQLEQLEQLRALHLGARIAVAPYPDVIPPGVDTPADVPRVEAALADARPPTRVLFVCMGNICRSPTAQGVAESMIARRGLGGRVEVDSAGTHAYHVGEPPDPRACRAAARRGYDLTAQRARRVDPTDFARFDHILAMDGHNLDVLAAMRPPGSRAELSRMLAFSTLGIADDVPDPYYGGSHGFEQVLDLLENAVATFLDRITQDSDGSGA